jgi:hypothetical protein
VFIVQAYLISQYVVLRSGIFLSKWRSSFAGSSDCKMNVQSACALNTQYVTQLPSKGGTSQITAPYPLEIFERKPRLKKERNVPNNTIYWLLPLEEVLVVPMVTE